jgi:hypothetical protein
MPWALTGVPISLFKMGRGGAMGVVCRDGAGAFMGASTLTVDGITNRVRLSCREPCTHYRAGPMDERHLSL